MIAIFYSIFLAMKRVFLATFIIFAISYFAIKVVTKFQNFGTFLTKNYLFVNAVVVNLR
jgi:hypothetical protein